MLVQMNAPPPHSQHYASAGDFKPPAASHFHQSHQSQHQSQHQSHHQQQHQPQHQSQFEPQHDDFDHPHFQHTQQSHHHHGFSHQHPWTSAGNALGGLGGLTHFGSYDQEPEDDEDPEHDPEDDDDHDDDVYGHSEDATTPTATTPASKRKSSSGGSSGGKKEVFMCPEVHCGKTFPRSFALRRHMRIHTGNKPYACDFEGCAQRFNTSGNLSRHKRIHSGERPYPCVFASCGKRFNTSTKLKRHMRIHFPDGQSLFHCVQQACTFACDNYKEYVHHQRQHGNPAYAVPIKGGGVGPQDENVDPSNLPTPTAKGSRAKGGAKPKRTAQPRVSKASKAAAEATTAALHGDFLAGLHPPSSADFGDRRGYEHSPSTSAASGLSMLMKEAHRENDFDEYDHRRAPPMKSHHQYPVDLDRPARLPFPTGAFPSESTGIASASPMNLNLSATFGSTFQGRSSSGNSNTNNNASSSSYYDHAGSSGFSATAASSSSTASSSFPSYLRGPPSDGYAPHHGHHASSSASYLGFPPLRPEDADDGYDSASPRGSGHQHHQSSHHSQHQSTHHAQHGGDTDDDDKYGGYGNVPHAVGPEFTGEELSAVLELMKDS